MIFTKCHSLLYQLKINDGLQTEAVWVNRENSQQLGSDKAGGFGGQGTREKWAAEKWASKIYVKIPEVLGYDS